MKRAAGFFQVKRAFLTLVILGAFGCVTPTKDISQHIPTGQERRDLLYTQGEALSQMGQSAQATALFKELLLLEPQSVLVKMRLVQEYRLQGLLREALALVQEVLETDPESGAAQMKKAEILVQLENYTQAIAILEPLVQKQPQNFEALILLGSLYAERQDWKRAQVYFKKLTEVLLYPSPERAHFYLGQVLQESSDKQSLKQAQQQYEKALQLKPSYVEAALALAALYFQQGQVAQSQALLENWQTQEGPHPEVAQSLAELYMLAQQFEKAARQIRYVSGSIDLRYKLALHLADAKKFSEAAQLLEGLRQEVPESDKVLFYLAQMYVELNENEKAYQTFQLMPYFSPFYVDAINSLSILARQLKKTDQALSFYQKALEKVEEAAPLWVGYARLLSDLDKNDQAEAILNTALEKFPQDSSLLYARAIAFEKRGMRQAGLDFINKILELEPDHGLALNFVANHYAENEMELDKALQMSQRALATDVTNPYFLDTVGLVYFAKKEYREARVWFEKALEGAGRDPGILEHLAVTYYFLGLIPQAQTYLQLAIEQTPLVEGRARLNEKLAAIQDPKVVRPDRIPAAQGPDKK